MELVPRLAPEVTRGCRRIDGFLVLHEGHREQLAARSACPTTRFTWSLRDTGRTLQARGRESDAQQRLLYVGKLSFAKGLPSLLDAFDRLRRRCPQLELHVAGGGSGPEAEGLRDRMKRMAPFVTIHGQLSQPKLADLMRRSTICVLPSFYEGLPLVLAEAFACGCRVVATDLPGIVKQLAPSLGDALELVSLPRLIGVDAPHPDDVPGFVERLDEAIERSLGRPPLGDPHVSMPGLSMG